MPSSRVVLPEASQQYMKILPDWQSLYRKIPAMVDKR